MLNAAYSYYTLLRSVYEKWTIPNFKATFLLIYLHLASYWLNILACILEIFWNT